MKRQLFVIALMGGLFFTACKKNRTCECKNANGVYEAGQIEATKRKAKKHCESLSTSTTECYLK